MKKRLKKLLLVAFIASILPASNLLALNSYRGPIRDIYYEGDDFQFGLTLDATFVKGETSELVFSPSQSNRIFSELDWTHDDTLMIGGIASVQFKKRWSFNLGYWEQVNNPSGTVTDSDFSFTTVTFTDPNNPANNETTVFKNLEIFSKSDTDQVLGRTWDLNAGFTFLKVNANSLSSMLPVFSADKSSLTAQVMLGFHHSEWGWEAFGGQGSQGDLFFNFAPDLFVLAYEYEMDHPYVGAGVQIEDENFGLNAYFKLSQWSDIEAFDQHPLRNLHFRDSINNGEWWSFGLDLSWKCHKDWEVTFSWVYEELKRSQGDTLVIDFDQNFQFLFPDGGGIRSIVNSVSVAFTFKIPN